MAWRDFRVRGPVRWVIAIALGCLWWGAVLRLAVQPSRAGPVEGVLAVGGWGLSLLPVHCVPWTRRGTASARADRAATTASPPRRSDA
ncbi:hypothetical protein [Streptomyces sp. H27-D2]|uniref:hypothetical protein n=1 Tax=Streptomyces sp. H27-D2 TaxID=3046304 RepID=UPI002DBB4DD9|nr:hypothetical protein [Streptomyces sp. H27-D2]MEC4015906.1 hypothetical protein [Streptomyces sp. H27-D2]